MTYEVFLEINYFNFFFKSEVKFECTYTYESHHNEAVLKSTPNLWFE